MTSPSVTHGTFSDYRRVKTRSVVQVTIEIPMERWDDALKALGGSPMPGKEPWVAVALLKEEPKPEPAKPDVMRSMVGKERYANAPEMEKAVTRAALLCSSIPFQGFLSAASEKDAVDILRAKLGIVSRSDIGKDITAYRRFLRLEDDFRAYEMTNGFSPHLTGQRS